MNRFARWLARCLGVMVATVGTPFAAFAAEDGWFDASASSTPEPGQPAPAPTPAPARESLPPSPLLDDGNTAPDPADQDPEALTKWRPYLDPYGTWVDDPRYGRVWIPNANVVGPGFQPYVSNGRWAVGDDGEWVWVSDYPFGWVVFHYGRWVWIGSSWAWVPGLRYAPAWVVWRVPSGTYAYVGWAPAPPSFVWFGGIAVHYHYDPFYPWVFCPSHYLFHHHIHHYVVRDAYWAAYAHRHTRPYVVRAPRARSSAPPAAVRRSPTYSAARVPAHAVPRERARLAYPRDGRDFRDTPRSYRSDSRVERSRRAAGASPKAHSLDERPSRSRVRPSEREYRPHRATPRTLPQRSAPRARPDVRATPSQRRPRR